MVVQAKKELLLVVPLQQRLEMITGNESSRCCRLLVDTTALICVIAAINQYMSVLFVCDPGMSTRGEL